jgi:hypothetical protein
MFMLTSDLESAVDTLREMISMEIEAAGAPDRRSRRAARRRRKLERQRAEKAAEQADAEGLQEVSADGDDSSEESGA